VFQQVCLFLGIKVNSYNIVFKIAKKKIRSLKLKLKGIFQLHVLQKPIKSKYFAAVIERIITMEVTVLFSAYTFESC
jgi:hypothetical protein